MALYTAKHFMGTGPRKDHHQVGRTDLVLKVRRHLGEDLGLTSVLGTYILVSSCHAVITAYDHYTHFCLLFYKARTPVRDKP